MKFIYNKNKDQFIMSHENTMLEKYTDIISSFSSLFEQYNCSLKIQLFWIDFSPQTQSECRLPFKNGYSCFVCCDVQRNGKTVQIRSTDGEVDYYSLSVSWLVSSIEKLFFKSNVLLYSDTSDAENDIKELFQLLSNGQ